MKSAFDIWYNRANNQKGDCPSTCHTLRINVGGRNIYKV